MPINDKVTCSCPHCGNTWGIFAMLNYRFVCDACNYIGDIQELRVYDLPVGVWSLLYSWSRWAQAKGIDEREGWTLAPWLQKHFHKTV